MMTLTLGSLFDGMGGFPLAFAQAGVVTRWLVELELDCRRVSAKHFPEAQAHVDVRDVGAHNLEPVDIITAGFPCQDLSVAGARAGLVGARSGLFFEIVRIVREMREATANEYPTYLVLENVPGLLSSHRGRDFAVVLGELADLGAVDIGWRVCDAQFWGVAQRRRRVFVVASFRAGASAAEILFEREGSSGHPPSRRTAGQDVARGAAVGAAFGGNNTSGPLDVACGLNAKGGSGRSDFETETFVAERLPEVAHSLRAQAQLAHRADVDTLVPDTIAFTSKDHGADATADLSPTLRAMMHDQSHSNGGGQVAVAFTTRDVASALTSNYAKQPDNSDTALGPNLAIAFQQNQRDEVRDLGDRVGALSAQPGMKQQNYIAQAVAFTERTRGDGVALETQEELAYALLNPGDGGRPKDRGVLTPTMAVRRLTPLECLRLQGYPDDWFDGLNLSDSAKYRMCGNSVAVPVVAWLARRLAGC